jgi:hypothetical protein
MKKLTTGSHGVLNGVTLFLLRRLLHVVKQNYYENPDIN